MSEKISKIDDVLVTVEKSVKSAISEIDRKKKVGLIQNFYLPFFMGI